MASENEKVVALYPAIAFPRAFKRALT